MKLLILGATGPTGREVVTRALGASHSVAVLVRNPSVFDPGVEVIQGDATNPATIARAVVGRDAVLSALGVGKSFKSRNLMQQAAANIVKADVKRLIFVSAAGVGESFSEVPLPMKIFIRTLLRGIYADKAIADATIRKSGFEWTIVRPVALTDGSRTGQYRAGVHLPLSGIPTISRADVADFMVHELADRKWIRKTVTIAS